MKKRIVIIGVSGQLGYDIERVFSSQTAWKLFPLRHRDLDVADERNMVVVLDAIQPDIIINLAAYHAVDEVEKNPQQAFLINAIAPKNLAKYAEKRKKTICFISSDYVFGQDTKRTVPYKESDAPGPVNTYGVSKLAGEYFVRTHCKKHFIVRTSGLFGIHGPSGKKGLNFIELMKTLYFQQKQLFVVNDQTVSPTYTIHLAQQLTHLFKSEAYGLYHISSEGSCTWYEFAKEIFRQLHMHPKITPVPSSYFPYIAKRPGYSVLSKELITSLCSRAMPNWRIGLSQYMQEKG